MTSEYPTVLKLSKHRQLLKKLHDTQISEKTALQTIFAYLDENEVCEVRFTGKKGPGCCFYLKTSVTIRLPAESSNMLTLGMTLHEIAHGLHHLDQGGCGHGVSFVKILDKLIESEIQWVNHSY